MLVVSIKASKVTPNYTSVNRSRPQAKPKGNFHWRLPLQKKLLVIAHGQLHACFSPHNVSPLLMFFWLRTEVIALVLTVQRCNQPSVFGKAQADVWRRPLLLRD